MLMLFLACSSNKVLDEGEEFDDNSDTDSLTGIETPSQEPSADPSEPEDGENDNGTPDDVPEQDTAEPDPEISISNIEVCYPGSDLSYTLCFETVEHQSSWGEDYDYQEGGEPPQNSDW